MRQKIDEYLDDSMGREERSHFEAELRGDARLREMLNTAQGERALRAAVYASYEPSADEARLLAARAMGAMDALGDAPVGRIGVWVRRISAVAAVLVLAVGAYAVGSMKAETPKTPAKGPVFYVLSTNELGDTETRAFASLTEANEYVKQMDIRQPVVVANNDGDLPLGFDPDRPGQF
jgi:hypothetical protein